VGLDEQESERYSPFKVEMKNTEHIATFFDPFGKESLLAGVSLQTYITVTREFCRW